MSLFLKHVVRYNRVVLSQMLLTRQQRLAASASLDMQQKQQQQQTVGVGR